MSDTSKGNAVVTDRTYQFILPPGWYRVDLRKAMASQVKELVDGLVAQAPAGPQQSRVRVAATNQLTMACQEAKANGVLDLVLPAKLIEGALMSASWAFLPLETPAGSDPIELLAAIASQDTSASLVEIQDLVALRIWSRAQRSEEALQQAVAAIAVELDEPVPEVPDEDQAVVWTHRVQYLLGHPQRPECWLIAAFSGVDGGDEQSVALTDALVELFDEVIQTVRFPHA